VILLSEYEEYGAKKVNAIRAIHAIHAIYATYAIRDSRDSVDMRCCCCGHRVVFASGTAHREVWRFLVRVDNRNLYWCFGCAIRK